MVSTNVRNNILFQSTPPARGGRLRKKPKSPSTLIFQSTPPRGGRPTGCAGLLWISVISIHAPREGGDIMGHGVIPSFAVFQSTPPARGATSLACAVSCAFSISIHAPREGGDNTRRWKKYANIISIHAPREGGDVFPQMPVVVVRYFNPRPPRGGRQQRCTVLPVDL